MKKILLTIFYAVLLIPSIAFAQPGEKVDLFKAEYLLKNDGLIEVTETINYDFSFGQRHGIYRYIPYKYNIEGKTVYVNISKVKVNASFEKYTENGNLVLKIGDKNKTVTGKQTYTISYLVKGGLRYFNDRDEFYWNVNGFGWEVPVNSISATVTFDKQIEPSTTCYVGVYGSKEECSVKELGGRKVVFYGRPLARGENLTVAVGFPKGTFPVTSAGFMGSGISDSLFWTLVALFAVLPLGTFLFMVRHYWKWGRDPKGRGPIVVQYEPPAGLRPVELGALLDFSVSNKDISSELIALARDGFLTITRIEKKFGKDDFLLKRVGIKNPNNKFDQTLLSGIFGSKKELKVSELKDFAEKAMELRSQVQEKLVTGGYFRSKVGETIGIYMGIGAGIGVLGFFIALGISKLGFDPVAYPFAVAFILSGIIVAVFGIFMPARTQKGVETKEFVLGFKRYLKAVEADYINFANAPKKDPKKFEEYLPYAMVFGVEKQWAKQFEGIYKGSPSWYNDPSGRAFAPVIFSSTMGNFASAASSSFTPASSSGSGGGGFSGGGFGGGGGGSW